MNTQAWLRPQPALVRVGAIQGRTLTEEDPGAVATLAPWVLVAGLVVVGGLLLGAGVFRRYA